MADIEDMSLQEVLEALDLESMRLLLAKVRKGEVSAAELATAQQALKRHGIAVVSSDDSERRELEDALKARRNKRKNRAKPVLDGGLDMDELGRFGGMN